MIARALAEAAGVVAVGLLLALAANQLSPRGLSLRRDYFPAAASPGSPAPQPATDRSSPAPSLPAPAPGAGTVPATNHSADATGGVPEALRARLAARGLSAVSFDEVRTLYDDPRRVQDLVVFVDARNDAHYREGHVPGAYPFDHYYPDKYLPALLPVCEHAEQIVVYCTGGDCEDSEFAATALKDTGVPAERLKVYVGGIDEWQARGMPVETGTRGSGELRGGQP